MPAFSDPETVARYAEGPARQVPGFRDMQRMAAILLAESAGESAHILVLGAGGGLELRSFADLQPGWQFTGVDPSPRMLELAAEVVGPHAARVSLHKGYIDDAPEGPFDGATCLLVLHFLQPQDRLRTLIALRARLRPGAPLVIAHHSIPQADREIWLDRYAAFSAASGNPADRARDGARKIGRELPLLTPEEDEALLREAGFERIGLFYAGFTFRGWVAFAEPLP